MIAYCSYSKNNDIFLLIFSRFFKIIQDCSRSFMFFSRFYFFFTILQWFSHIFHHTIIIIKVWTFPKTRTTTTCLLLVGQPAFLQKNPNAGAFLYTEKCPSVCFLGESRTTIFFWDLLTFNKLVIYKSEIFSLELYFFGSKYVR